jgi:hypothetical protein
LEIVIGIGILLFGCGDYQIMGLLFLGLGIFSLLIILLGSAVIKRNWKFAERSYPSFKRRGQIFDHIESNQPA